MHAATENGVIPVMSCRLNNDMKLPEMGSHEVVQLFTAATTAQGMAGCIARKSLRASK